MSSAGPMTERVVRAVLLALWWGAGEGGVGETSMQAVLRETLAPVPEVKQALAILRQRGCLIEEEPTGALRLVSTGLACWRDVLEELAKRETWRIGRRVMVFFRTGSTNDVAWQCPPPALNPEMDGLVVLADEQETGRGRLGHEWLAKAEQSVLMSVLLGGEHNRGSENAEWLTMVAGLAVAAAVEQAAPGIAAHIKWPNDVLIEGRKVAGILVERRGEAVVVGIGVNVMQAAADFPAALVQRATSLYQATGHAVDRLRVVVALVRKLNAHLAAEAAEVGGGEGWIGEWKRRCGMIGTQIRARAAAGIITGEVVDVDPLEGLVVRDPAGAVHFLSAQTTTLSPDAVEEDR